MQFIENNYFKTSGHGKKFKFEMTPPKNLNSNFHEKCKEIAKMVWDNKQGKIHLMYSGGVDSEYVLSVFLELGMDVTPVIIKLNPRYNEHDVKYAFDFCESKKLKPVIVDINFDKFVTSGEIIDIASSVKCVAHQLPSTYKVIAELDGTVVMGSHGPPHLTKNSKDNKWYVTEHEPIHTVLNWFKKNKIYGCPFFLVYTPEQYLSFIQHPLMVNLVNNRIPGKLGNNSTKYLVYNDFSGYNFKERPKFTGYENIESSKIFSHENLQSLVNAKSKYWGIYYTEYYEFMKAMSVK